MRKESKAFPGAASLVAENPTLACQNDSADPDELEFNLPARKLARSRPKIEDLVKFRFVTIH
jgi:hypothetical protein